MMEEATYKVLYFRNVTIIRTRGCELRTRLQSGRLKCTHSRVCVRLGGRVPPHRLPLFSVFSPQCRCLHPSPPILCLVHLFQSLPGCSCLPVLGPELRSLPCASSTSASLSPRSVSPAHEPPRPMKYLLGSR